MTTLTKANLYWMTTVFDGPASCSLITACYTREGDDKCGHTESALEDDTEGEVYRVTRTEVVCRLHGVDALRALLEAAERVSE